MKGALAALMSALWLGTVLAADAPAGVSMQGFARYESNKWLFRACVGRGKVSALNARGLPFIDATPDRVLTAAIQQRWQQSAEPLRGIYLEITGYVEEGRVTATQLHRALGWVASCAERPSNIPDGARAWAAGNEPSWGFVLDGKSATLRTMDGVLTWPAAVWKPDGSTAVFEASAVAGRIRVELSDGLCSDTMSEAAFGRRVVAAVNGAFYTGCGLIR
ncbi:MAG: hypothetical protein H6R02_3145 [Burkholderiaceae bacterium]|nr:hypothetical protein [Burkholderiaceae bacterium]